MIHNRYLPLWLHRICNGVFGAALLLGVASYWFSDPAGSWGYFVSRCLIWVSVPVGIILALLARRFSIVQGVVGGNGYDELHDSDDKKPVVQLSTLGIITRMETSSTRFVVYSTLMTLGVVLMLLGIWWLMCLGIALIALATFFFSLKRVRGGRLRGFALYAIVWVVLFASDASHMHDGAAFAQKIPPVWFWILVIAAWLWSIASEFQRWRKGGSVP